MQYFYKAWPQCSTLPISLCTWQPEHTHENIMSPAGIPSSPSSCISQWANRCCWEAAAWAGHECSSPVLLLLPSDWYAKTYYLWAWRDRTCSIPLRYLATADPQIPDSRLRHSIPYSAIRHLLSQYYSSYFSTGSSFTHRTDMLSLVDHQVCQRSI